MSKEGMVYFISGIDTDAGKTVATGAMLRWLLARGVDATSMKLVQTGCDGAAEDLVAHRAAAGLGETADDREGLTAPQIFSFPSSPVLAARLEGREVDVEKIAACAAELKIKNGKWRIAIAQTLIDAVVFIVCFLFLLKLT